MLKPICLLILASTLVLQAHAVDGLLQKYVSDADMYEISNRETGPRTRFEGTAIRLDTRDAVRCMHIIEIVRRTSSKVSKGALDDLCKVDRENPFKDIVILQTAENQELLNYIKSGVTLGLSAYESKSSKSNRADSEEVDEQSNEFILSPLFAAMVSESIEHLRTYVRHNNGKAARSRLLGSTILVITNPAETIADIINGFYNYRFIQDAKTKVILRDYRDYGDEDPRKLKGHSPAMNALEFKLEFRF